ncbi:MAG: sigma 54-interacting transcriptional regulator [Candidatus Krumholzibacteria bacterium]|nr:sigma 54-interacting transcriptional regulator [Candidatus Krumholzibacteria bacterium]
MKEKREEKMQDFFTGVENDLRRIEESDAVTRSRDLGERLANSERRLEKLERLTSVTRSMNSTLNLNELLAKIVDSIIALADTDRGFLMLRGRSGELEFRIARDRRERPLGETDFEVSTSIIDEVAEKGEPLFISDLNKNSRFKDQKSVLDLQLKTAVCLPLKVEDRVVGVIYTDASRLSVEIAEEDMPILGAFAAQAAIAIENARLHGELVLSRERLARENQELKAELSEKYEFSGIIGKSRQMQEIFGTVGKIAPFETTVLIHGETGTGKELIARAIHFNSPRKTKQLVTINCGAMPAELLESELFGHKKGSFSGATSDKAGLFETANGGTLFLDEIGDMPTGLQVKLLRALQEGEIRRVGENVSRSVDVRVIAATNRDLAGDIKSGRFRQDLFYRLNVVPITIPPLRERKDDILPLALHFLEKYSAKMGKDAIEISPAALRLMLSGSWPGNVRELENMIERALATCGDSKRLTPEHFPQIEAQEPARDESQIEKSLKDKLRVMEKRFILDALERNEWKITRAAESLEVTRQHLHNKIRQYGLNNHRK